jgi:hypothetical protein
MKKWVAISIGVVAVGIIGYAIWDANLPVYLGLNMHGADTLKIEAGEWQPTKAIDPADSTHVYRVIWTQKYGDTKVAYCKIVFKNDKTGQYKLVAPWTSGIEIERSNMDDIQFDKLPIDSVPAGVLVAK